MSPDVKALLAAAAAPDFVYREITRAQDAEAALRRWPLLLAVGMRLGSARPARPDRRPDLGPGSEAP